MRKRKSLWLFGIGLVLFIQLISAYGITQYPYIAAAPPLRLSLIVAGQLIFGLAIGWQFQFARDTTKRYIMLLSILYLFSLSCIFGPLRPQLAGINIDHFRLTVGTESLVSIVVLIGFSIMNVALLARLFKVEQ